MYSAKEEQWNVITHALGVVLAVVALVVLLVFNSERSPYSILAILLYTLSLFFLYTASTLYHWFTSEKLKRLFRKLDHIGIYYLIAGTYTPVALISLWKVSGWRIFIIVWSIALAGTLLKVFLTGKLEKLSLLLYLGMGWLIVFDFNSLWNVQSGLGITLLALGGAFYTLGTIFYVRESIPYNHAIWHLFVLAGSIFHFFFILIDVI